MRLEKWEEAKIDLMAAILQGVDIVEAFRDTHDSIVAFEKEIGVKLPEDIVELLTPRQEPFEINRETRIALAMKYYENRELSSGLAARLAGVSRAEFIFLMGEGTDSLPSERLKNSERADFKNAEKAGHLQYKSAYWPLGDSIVFPYYEISTSRSGFHERLKRSF